MDDIVIPSEDLNIKVNEKLFVYALALPVHNVTHKDAIEISKLLQSVNKDNIAQTESAIERIVMHPHGRTLWLENRLSLIPCFKDICSIVDFAYISYCRGNPIGVYFSLLPIVEGIILRWMGIAGARLKFDEIKKWVKNKKNNSQLLNSHPFAPIWVEALSRILVDEFFKYTGDNPTYAYFNRHAGAHLLQNFNLNAIRGLSMRIFIIIELLVEIYVIENKFIVDSVTIPLLLKNSAETGKRLYAYKLAYDWLIKPLQEHPEAILGSMY